MSENGRTVVAVIDVIGRKMITTRKPHVCFGCGRPFPPKTKMERSAVVDDVMWTCYLCETCVDVSQELGYGDEYGFGELRERALELESERAKNGR